MKEDYTLHGWHLSYFSGKYDPNPEKDRRQGDACHTNPTG
jgi:hypothetical protein